MVQAWRTAARAARWELDTITAAALELDLGRAYSEYVRDRAKAIEQWERIFNTYASADDDTYTGMAKRLVSPRLAQELLGDAVDKSIGASEADLAAAKLEMLAKRDISDPNDVVALSLTIYYRLDGRKLKARLLLRPLVKRAIERLSGNGPTDFLLAHAGLFEVLLAAGDVNRAISIAQAIGQLSDCRTEDGKVPFICYCDGQCDQSLPTLEGLWFCPICWDTGFCLECCKLLEMGAVEIKKCGPKHVRDFIYIRRRPKQFKRGEILVDGEIIAFEEWKRQLQTQWDL
ncbi:hypothetical protein BDV10DRAFT_189216 [Aspergillus recurvatus]